MSMGGSTVPETAEPSARQVQTVEPPACTAQSTAAQARTNTTRRHIKAAFIFQCVMLIIVTSVLTAQQIQFRNTWHQESDYDIKVWSTVAISWYVVSYTFQGFLFAIELKRRDTTHVPNVWALLFQRLMQLFKFSWFLYGIKVVLVRTRTGDPSETWGAVLWWLEFVVSFIPLACYCVLISILICYVWASPPQSETRPEPFPAEDRNKLDIKKYKEVQDYIESQQLPDIPMSSGTADVGFDPTTTREGPRDDTELSGEINQDPLGPYSDLAISLTGMPLPDMAHFRRLQSGSGNIRFPSKELQSPGKIPSRGTSAVIGNTAATSVACPVCFCEFETNDDIVQMPCDKRHIFHKDCLFAWFDKSCHCPVCRCNIAELLKTRKDESRP